MKLYQQLEQTFKMRLNSNSEIIPYIKKLSEMGKFDEPKKIAAIAILLDRLGKMEDEADMEKLLHGASSGSGEIESEKSLQELTEAIEEKPLNLESSDEQLRNDLEKNINDRDEYIASLKAKADVSEEKTVSTFTPDAITDPPAKETQPDTSTAS